MIEQKLINLRPCDGQFYNFFNTPGSMESLERYLANGWVVKEMDIDKNAQAGWVLLEREGK